MTEPKSYRQQVIESAIQGLVQGGWSQDQARSLEAIFARVYDCGYHECRREHAEWLSYERAMTGPRER